MINSSKQSGFTIVELLIVIVVIAILAAISVVTFSGIQNRAKTSSGQQLAAQVESKAQAFYTVKSHYPKDQATFADVPEAKLEGGPAGNLQAATITDITSDSGKKVSYVPCGTGDEKTGAKIGYWDFTKSPAAAVEKTIGECPAAPGVSGP